VRIDWDDGKSDKLKRERGFSFAEVASVLEGPHPLMCRSEDPEQWVGIGFAMGELVSVVHEFGEDYFGDFIWLVTYWKATREEAKIYEEFR
jgi:uncharacterized DUF497 family protein